MEKPKKRSSRLGRLVRLLGRKTKRSDYYDYNLVAMIVLLTSFGLIMLYSTSAYMAQINFKNDMYFFRRQAIISAVCFFGMLILSRQDYHKLEEWSVQLYGAALFLMLLVKTPLGYTSNGARRWLALGPIKFQPAEVAKLAVIVMLPVLVVHMGEKLRQTRGLAIVMVMGTLQALVAYVFTDNLSTAMIIFGISVGLLFVAIPDYRIFVKLGLLAVGFAALLVYLVNRFIKPGVSFRLDRILVWLHPEDFADGKGYQTLQGLYAIGSGGWFGRGLGNSIQKLGSVPEAQNDFIFSIICEELGIFGAVIVIIMFGYLLYRIFFVAQNAPDMLGTLMAAGVFIHIALQVVLNILVVVGWMPNTGVTLPFISYGGTSVLFLMSEMGLVLSIGRQIQYEDPNRLL